MPNGFRHLTTALGLTAALLLTAAGCSPDSSNKPTNPIDSAKLSATLTPIAGHLVIGDASGSPLVGAKVMIGTRENVPFAGNVLVTDGNGMIAVPAAWTDAQPVTVEAAGFVRATWMAQSPTASVFQVRRKSAAQKMELKGKATGFRNLAKDDWVDIALVFPALRRDQLTSLQVTDLVSPETDTISALGFSMEIPSNVSVPKQEERYFFTITLDKPLFRSYLNEARTWKMVSAHARFPIEEVVDELRDGKTFFDVLNYIEFKSASIKDIALSSPSTTQDLTIADTKFDAKLDVTAPRFSSSYKMLAVSVAENGGLLYPTDVKMFSPSETRRLVAPTGVPGFLVGVLRASNAPTAGAAADALSVVIAPNTSTSRFEFFDVPAAPRLRGSTLALNPPRASVATVTPAATYATLNKIDTITSGSLQIDRKAPIWDVYASGWSTSMDLPDMGGTAVIRSHRWEVLFGGSTGGTNVNLGPNLADGLSHATKSAVDL